MSLSIGKLISSFSMKDVRLLVQAREKEPARQ